ncbi:hypothetical protein GCM10010177_21380 [Actinomadura citrea]|nr:hypothetical protein GCM10010177_21380 [Actinomadura citrea]
MQVAGERIQEFAESRVGSVAETVLDGPRRSVLVEVHECLPFHSLWKTLAMGDVPRSQEWCPPDGETDLPASPPLSRATKIVLSAVAIAALMIAMTHILPHLPGSRARTVGPAGRATGRAN